MNSFWLWVATGFGIGSIPVAPGTLGSILGLAWFALLVALFNFWGFIVGTTVGIVFSIWCCHVAAKQFRELDPGAIVLDEITAVPLSFLAWAAHATQERGGLPGFTYFFGEENWLRALGIIVAFRFFDILKPWPVRQSQSLIGGLGITMDDVLAATYVNLLTLLLILAA